jgi:hypothetical protein
MRKLMIVPVLGALALGACEPAAERNVAGSVTVTEGSNVEGNVVADNADGNALAAVLAMSDRQRNVVFVRALMDAELPCDGVKGSERLPDVDGKPVWRVECRGVGGYHMVSITPDGTANILSRNDR